MNLKRKIAIIKLCGDLQNADPLGNLAHRRLFVRYWPEKLMKLITRSDQAMSVMSEYVRQRKYSFALRLLLAFSGWSAKENNFYDILTGWNTTVNRAAVYDNEEYLRIDYGEFCIWMPKNHLKYYWFDICLWSVCDVPQYAMLRQLCCDLLEYVTWDALIPAASIAVSPCVQPQSWLHLRAALAYIPHPLYIHIFAMIRDPQIAAEMRNLIMVHPLRDQIRLKWQCYSVKTVPLVIAGCGEGPHFVKIVRRQSATKRREICWPLNVYQNFDELLQRQNMIRAVGAALCRRCLTSRRTIFRCRIFQESLRSARFEI